MTNTTTVNTTVEKFNAMAMVWDEDHDTNVESEMFMVREVDSTTVTFQHNNSADMQEFVHFMHETFS